MKRSRVSQLLEDVNRSRKRARDAGVPSSVLYSMDRLTVSQMEQMDQLTWTLRDLKEAEEAPPEPPSRADREVIETVRTTAIVYQNEKVRCGKKRCKCNRGALHGPYWYAYQRKGGKMTSRYIGKKAPGSVYRARKRKAKK
jgi:hypothetical protein